MKPNHEEIHSAILEDFSDVIAKHLPKFDNNLTQETWKLLELFTDEAINQLKEKSTYHGLIKVSCIVCDFVTSDVSEMEMLNDLDGNCPKCENKFFRWENKDGSVVVSYTDEEGNYDNLVMEVE